MCLGMEKISSYNIIQGLGQRKAGEIKRYIQCDLRFKVWEWMKVWRLEYKLGLRV